MDELHIYQVIADSIRKEIIEGKLKPGDRLSPVRKLTATWGCTPSTIQRAYHELAGQGLIISRAGKGTHVTKFPIQAENIPLRRAGLINRMESILIEILTAGYTPFEVEQAMETALTRWKSFDQGETSKIGNIIHYAGSHDPAINWLSIHFPEYYPQYGLHVDFIGSLGGLISLAEGKSDLAGCHLWDEETNTYNIPYIRRLLPNKKMAVITFAQRNLGFILPMGNPMNIRSIRDIRKAGVIFINRQNGSGTRVWLDAILKSEQINSSEINGYDHVSLSHASLSREIAEGNGNLGIGIEASAKALGLDFVLLTKEQYDLVVSPYLFEQPNIQALIHILQSKEFKLSLDQMGGYDNSLTGIVNWVI